MSPLSAALVAAIRAVAVDVAEGTFTVGGRSRAAASAKELRRALADTLYWALHAGVDPAEVPAGWVPDAELEQRLLEAVPHTSSRMRVRFVGSGSHPDTWIADIDGLRVRVPAGAAAPPGPGGEVLLELPGTRPRLSPGFFLVDGSRGHGLGRGPTVRIYAHATEVAELPAIWAATLGTLERLAVPYRAKIASAAFFQARYDGLVVYLGQGGWRATAALAGAIHVLPGVGSGGSVFTRRLRPGIGLAWEPVTSGTGRADVGFGQHRADALAAALIAHSGLAGFESKCAAVADVLRHMGIDPRYPWRAHVGDKP